MTRSEASTIKPFIQLLAEYVNIFQKYRFPSSFDRIILLQIDLCHLSCHGVHFLK